MDGLLSLEEIRQNVLEKFSFMETDGKSTWNEGHVKNKGMNV